MDSKPKRIFWLGMHKILKPTELRRLRELGYEVFNPPYISSVFDQSADLRVDDDQPTTLPRDVFNMLIRHNFFYSEIPKHITEVLNNYFDCVIVTINPDWFKSIISTFEGPVIFRIYGQPYSLSNHLIELGLWERIITRGDIHIVPFSDESIEEEHSWFKQLCTESVPYQISGDVFFRSKTWGEKEIKPEIATNIPNIQNPYYSAEYHKFFTNYPQNYFRIYGPQRTAPADPRIQGELRRDILLDKFARSAAFFYGYQDNVCYLPPIEMMEIGGPVVYLRGSLLDRFNNTENPGAATGPSDAELKLDRLVKGDRVLASEIIDAQEIVRRRYDPKFSIPIFDRVFTDLLDNLNFKLKRIKRDGRIVQTSSSFRHDHDSTIVIPLHIDGLFHIVKGNAFASEGIPRVVDVVIDFIVKNTNVHILISTTDESKSVLYDFFSDHILSGRLSLYVFDSMRGKAGGYASLLRIEFANYLNDINRKISYIFIPHYYLFPECLLFNKNIVLYLPDYFPFLMPGDVFDTSVEKDAANKRIGVAISKKATRILTNSEFTKNYLPATGFVEKDQQDKIVVAPLPFLGKKRAHKASVSEVLSIQKKLDGRPFLFYPTANRPNKKLAFLMRLLARLRLDQSDISLILTCRLEDVPEVRNAVDDFRLGDAVLSMPGLSEQLMRWFYENTIALCLTSVTEGNFPPQMLEALNYGAPIVATRLPTITEVLMESSDRLLLCDPLNLTDFCDNVELARTKRTEVLSNQNYVLARLKDWNSDEAFLSRFSPAFPTLAFHPRS